MERYIYATAILILCEMTVYVLGLFHLGYLLNRQLLLLVILNDEGGGKMNKIQLNLLKTATKVAVLQTIYTISVISDVFITVICNILDNEWTDLLDWICYFISVFVGTWCIYLTFKVNEKEYHCLCKCCDGLCERMCHKAVKLPVVPQKIKSLALSHTAGQVLHELRKSIDNNALNSPQSIMDVSDDEDP